MTNDLGHNKQLLRSKKRILQRLKERAATYEPLGVPFELFRQIDNLKEEIRELETEMATLNQLSPSLKALAETTAERPAGRELAPNRERKPAGEGNRAALVAIAGLAVFLLVGAMVVSIGLHGFYQTTGNRAPVISGAVSSPGIIPPRSTSMLTVTASDQDGDALTFTWAAQMGNVPAGPRADSTITYRAPDHSGDDIVKVIVSDGRGGVAEASVTIRIVMGESPTSPTKVAMRETPTNTPTFPTKVAMGETPTNTPTSLPTSTPADTPVAATPLPTASVGITRVRLADGMVMVYVPAGSFLMGASANDIRAENDEKPQHEIYLDAFWIDKYEVTNGQYKECTRAGQCATPPGISSNYYFSFDDHPINAARWTDARAYCQWAEARLPTEAQWEKAARGPDQRTYPWGGALVAADKANFCDASCAVPNKDTSANDEASHMTTVGSYPAGASPYGALDMAGNVWEWVSDAYLAEYYKTSPEQVGPNPTGPDLPDTFNKVLRGGSWRSLSSDLRASNRNALPPDYPAGGTDDIGFRCVMLAETP